MALYNKVDRRLLKQKVENTEDKRTTLSFYAYANIGNPGLFRDHVFSEWEPLGVFGRVYVATEGINAQISLPEVQFENFKKCLSNITFLENIRLNVAIEDDGKSFYKLKIKVRNKIVADGLDDSTFDVTNRGKHLSAEEFNQLTDKDETILIDMRNHYESEVGHFEGAILPDVDTFREELEVVEEMLTGKEDQPIVMYCTGGIRCEKASAWLKHKGFDKVHQLDGGIIEYARQVKEKGLANKFKGKNFVFDERLGERITEDVISNCHQCGRPSDVHVNCAFSGCNLLFLQCEGCGLAFDGCCSEKCYQIMLLPEEAKAEIRKKHQPRERYFRKGRMNKK